MLINEAKWIGERIQTLSLEKESVVLNFGSQTLKYNNDSKHLIDYVVNPIQQKCKLHNLDLQNDPGIDYCGDILDDKFFDELSAIMFDGVLLCNVLEHDTDIKSIAQRVGKLIKPGGFLIFSGPYKYPVHYDPIDNGFRPEIQEVGNLFDGYKIVNAEIITDFTYSYYLKKNTKQMILTIIRALTPFYKFNKWKKVVVPKFKWWNKKFEITCLLMEKRKIK